jgi:hypothetical protein
VLVDASLPELTTRLRIDREDIRMTVAEEDRPS